MTGRQRRLLALTVALLLAAPATARAQGTLICHATGDPNTPYQQLDIGSDASIDHLQHADDIVPAPPEGCPAQLVADEVDPAAPAPQPTVTAEPDVVPAAPQRPRKKNRRSGSRTPTKKPAPAPRAQVQPSVSAGNLQPTATVEAETLPMTGAEVPGIALMGVGFLLAGAGIRLRMQS